MRKRISLFDSALAAVLLLNACHKEGAAPASDAGPADRICSQSQPCAIASGTPEQGYICVRSGNKCLSGDQDWYVLDVPSPPLPRQLLSVKAVFPQQTSPVVLAFNVLKSDGRASLAAAVDQHLIGNPGAQLVVRLPDAGRYFIVVSNDPGGDPEAVERRFPYTLTATLSSDPDVNEPNDTAPTSVTLPTCGQVQLNPGALATTGDLDRFGFDVALCPGQARTILYLQVADTVDPAVRAAPLAPRINLQATLVPPSGPSRETHTTWTPTQAQKPAMAVLVSQAGHYELQVQGYKASPSDPAPAGDPRFTYQATVKTFADQDPSEGPSGNDTLGTATSVSLSVGQTKTEHGRLSFIQDADTFKIIGTGSPTRLHYKLTYDTAAGKFDPLPDVSPKVLEVLEDIGSGTTCRATCPGGADADQGKAWCDRLTADGKEAAACLWQRRLEDSEKLPTFQNFEGQLYLPANATRYLQVKYLVSPAADDKEYSLELEMLAGDPLQDGLGSAVDVSAGAPVATTVLGWGFGDRTRSRVDNNLDPLPTNADPPDPDTHEPGHRRDYDAASQVNFYKVSFSGAGTDRSLGIGWTIPPAAGQSPGSRSYDLGLRLHFCGDQTCSAANRVSSGFFDVSTNYGPWYNTQISVPYFDFNKSTGKATMSPTLCTCIDSAYSAAGYFYAEIKALDRASYADAKATLDLTVDSYGCSDAGTMPCGFVAAIKKN